MRLEEFDATLQHAVVRYQDENFRVPEWGPLCAHLNQWRDNEPMKPIYENAISYARLIRLQRMVDDWTAVIALAGFEISVKPLIAKLYKRRDMSTPPIPNPFPSARIAVERIARELGVLVPGDPMEGSLSQCYLLAMLKYAGEPTE